MLLSTFPTVHFEKTPTGFPSPNRKDIVAIKDVLSHFAPPAGMEACLRLINSHYHWDSKVIGLIGKDADCFQAEQSPLQEPFAFSLDLSLNFSKMDDSAASDPLSSEPKPSPSSKKIGLFHVKLPVKRPSLQSLRTQTFFQSSTSNYSTSASQARSFSVVAPTRGTKFEDVATIPIPAVSSPLLDEDPFANLHSSPPTIPFSEHPSTYSRSSTVLLPSQAHLQHYTLKRPKSSGHGQVRPANTKPAFSPRPSLPSLHTLAQMNIGIPRKARKGTPGARLPHEPWNMNSSTHLGSALNSSMEPLAGPSQPRRAATVPYIQVPFDAKQDFILSLGNTQASSSMSERRRTDPDDSGIGSRSADGRPASALYDDAEIDSLPSLSYTPSEPSSAFSRSSSIRSSPWSKNLIDQNSVSINHARTSDMFFAHENDGRDEDDPLSYHSDFNYYTQPHSDCSDSNSDLPSKVRYQAPSPEITPTPYTSLYSPDTSQEFSRSVHTMHGVLSELPRNNILLSSSPRLEDTPRDSNGTSEKRGSPPTRGGDEDRKDKYGGRREGNYSRNHSSGGYGHGGGGDDGDRGRKPVTHLPVWSDSSSSEDEGDNGTVYYSVDGTSNGHSSRPQSRAPSIHSRMIPGSGSDDDIPLAQRMPTALRAQKSIRRQLRDERHQRRMERAKSTRPAMASEQPPVPALPRPVIHSQQRSASVAPERSRRTPAPIEHFPVDDLAINPLMRLHLHHYLQEHPSLVLPLGLLLPINCPKRVS
ncbi:hypothetical protein K503DRAFT_402062 [Rhizopogon vinicolor AM-OR11-026]|uniref:Uncharacterized protein n=1 Tax=Rhizopogon vinicolor AM-OR11-026 TaxID=1314800 RepID=A0A1B7NBH9_9AGAM|nr:hypothetical protein K503DRAFT_402062 [Rhizopogon vinicolor AM-OR11-026]